MKKSILLVALVAAASAAHAQNLLNNGSFESGFLGWSASGDVGFASVEGASDGNYGAVFNAGNSVPNGVLSQVFATTPGSYYSLTFDYGTAGWGAVGQTMDVEVVGNSTLVNARATSSLPSGEPYLLPPGFGLFSFNFFANSTSTLVQFTDDPENQTISNDGVLDNISVVDPEPPVPDGGSTAALCGMSLATLGWLRRKLN